jgi:hypothetical protein
MVQDMMVKHEWLKDDNAKVMIPSYTPFIVNPDKPGVFIKVLKSPIWEQKTNIGSSLEFKFSE